MKLQKNKIAKKSTQYARRKFRTNTIAKVQEYDARVLVKKSLKHITAQVVDPQGNILASVSDKGMTGATKTDRATAAGKELAKKIAWLSVQKIIFDRNGFLYHGRIKAFADGLREGGITV